MMNVRNVVVLGLTASASLLWGADIALGQSFGLTNRQL